MHPAAKIPREALVQARWQVVPSEGSDVWWADESWRLACGDSAIWLTFLIDPQMDVHRRKKGEKLWAVKASSRLPTKWQNDIGDFTLHFGKNWRNRIPAFVRSLDCFRTNTPNKAPVPVSRARASAATQARLPAPRAAHL